MEDTANGAPDQTRRLKIRAVITWSPLPLCRKPPTLPRCTSLCETFSFIIPALPPPLRRPPAISKPFLTTGTFPNPTCHPFNSEDQMATEHTTVQCPISGCKTRINKLQHADAPCHGCFYYHLTTIHHGVDLISNPEFGPFYYITVYGTACDPFLKKV